MKKFYKQNEIGDDLPMRTAIELFFEKNLKYFFGTALLLCLVNSILLFDIRVSITGDDSSYILRAFNFIKNSKFPEFQGPLYPLILSPFVYLFGIKTTLLKGLSLVFMLGFIYFFYKTFKSRIPSSLLAIVLILLSINPYILYYSSQTYSEAFFLFLQMFFFFYFFKKFIPDNGIVSLTDDLKRHSILGIFILLLGITRTIGFISIFCVGLYFLTNKQWKNLLLITLSFSVIFILYSLLVHIIFQKSGFHFSSQASGLMNKNFYSPTSGTEDLPGYMNRIIENSNIYLSIHLFSLIGFRSFSSDPSTLLTVSVYIVMFIGLLQSFKRNKFMFFVILYSFIFLLGTFIILQTFWGQSRLIIPCFPLILTIFIYVLLQIFEFIKLRKYNITYFIIIILFLVPILPDLVKEIQKTIKIDSVYYGLSPDWENYLKLSEWTSANIPENEVIACRKPSNSFIYGNGREFLGIENVPEFSGKNIVNDWLTNENKYYAIYYTDLRNTRTDTILKNILFKDLILLLGYERKTVCLFKYNEDSRNEVYKLLNESKLRYYMNWPSLFSTFNIDYNEILFYNPDTLLNNLYKNRIRYIIVAKLRIDPDAKGNLTINTVERYVNAIKVKYPKIFTSVYHFGEPNNEPAWLLKINYEKYGLKY